jgi:hypothetical protein
VEKAERHGAWGILYGTVLALVALGGLVTIVDWSGRGDDLPGGGMPVTGRVIEEQPGFSGSLAIVEVAYEAGGKERRARLPVEDSAEHPLEPTYRPGESIDLLVSRTNPDRVHHASWNSSTPDSPIPGWVLAVAAAGVVGALALKEFGHRLQSAVAGALKNGGGRGI